MEVKVYLVDVNPDMVRAWLGAFEQNTEVEIIEGSLLDQQVDAWVSPTNPRGVMNGGLDAAVKGRLGSLLEARVQQEIRRRYGGRLPLGHATCVVTGHAAPKFLISTPTTAPASEAVDGTLAVALACAAAFQAVRMQNAAAPGSIASVALPGLGGNNGGLPVEVCADLMWAGYDLFRRQRFTDFVELRKSLEGQFGGAAPAASPPPTPAAKPGGKPRPAPAQPQRRDVDFDDFA